MWRWHMNSDLQQGMPLRPATNRILMEHAYHLTTDLVQTPTEFYKVFMQLTGTPSLSVSSKYNLSITVTECIAIMDWG